MGGHAKIVFYAFLAQDLEPHCLLCYLNLVGHFETQSFGF